MHIYLPIAELSVNVFLLLGMGAFVGFLSGVFGVGGGFLATPMLIFTGVPPAVAVASSANEITAASVSGAFAHWRRGGIDIAMGVVLTIGGAVGSFFGALLFKWLKALGQVDLLISFSYVLFLGSIGALMLKEAVEARRMRKAGIRPRMTKRGHDHWTYKLPFRMRFRKSRLYISALIPLMVGLAVGILSAVMGVGGGFIMIPAMIYLIGMPASVVVGTSLFQITFVTASVTYLHSVNSQTVDVVLAVILLAGAVIGAQLGSRFSVKLKPEELRLSLALMVLAVAMKMAFDLVVTPTDPFTIMRLEG